jgi:hypothetical protein
MASSIATIPYRDGGELLGVVFDAEFDAWLRWVSPANLAQAWHDVQSALQSVGIATRQLRFGWLHPGVAVVSRYTDGPFGYLGWLGLNERRGEREAQLEASVNGLGLRSGLPLRFGASYRTGLFDCDPGDGCALMQAVREYALDDFCGWQPELFNGPLAPELARVFAAVQDEQALATAMGEMARLCTPDGFAILQAGVDRLRHNAPVH